MLTFSVSVLSNSLEKMMVAPNVIIDGKPLVEYANIWWQWTYTMPQNLSPVRDMTGENCHQGQKGNVWFLAGGYGSSMINRKCEVPAGKHIFFPVINMIYYPRNGYSLSCDIAKRSAALNNNELPYIEIELDSVKAVSPANTRLASENCFDLLGLIPRELNPPKVYPSASDGYWVMLKPLSKGKHILTFKASYDQDNSAYGKMLQHIRYELTII